MRRRLMFALALILVGTTACGGRTLKGHGLQITLPQGWSGEIYGGRAFSVAHATNLELRPHARDDLAGGIAISKMTPRDVFVTVFEWRNKVPGAPFPPLRSELVLRARDRTPMKGFSTATATYNRVFTVGGHEFQVIVHFGAERPPASLVAKVDDALRSLRFS